jgi:hypothetical protein
MGDAARVAGDAATDPPRILLVSLPNLPRGAYNHISLSKLE